MRIYHIDSCIAPEWYTEYPGAIDMTMHFFEPEGFAFLCMHIRPHEVNY